MTPAEPQDSRAYAVGLSDDAGAASNLGLATKVNFMPTAAEVARVDQYINCTLFGVKPDTARGTLRSLQDPATDGVRAKTRGVALHPIARGVDGVLTAVHIHLSATKKVGHVDASSTRRDERSASFLLVLRPQHESSLPSLAASSALMHSMMHMMHVGVLDDARRVGRYPLFYVRPAVSVPL